MNKFIKWLSVLLLLFATGLSWADDVILGAGDQIKISVYNNPDLALDTKISEEGNITFPLVGVVTIAGLTTSSAEKKLADLLRQGGYVKKPEVNITITTVQSQLVSVIGQVNKPGRYPLEGRRSITDILAMAGGVSSEGGETITVVRSRNGKSAKRTVDILEMVKNGDLAENYDLEANDLIFVDRYPRFYIYGEVQRPGVYRLEKSMTLLQAVSTGGGITLRGTERNVRIKRRDKDGVLQIIDAKHDDLLQPDDVVFVQESFF